MNPSLAVPGLAALVYQVAAVFTGRQRVGKRGSSPLVVPALALCATLVAGAFDFVSRPLLAITQAMATSFKKELFEAAHNFLASGGHTFKIALYTSSATLDATTTAYSATNEVSGTGYTAAGNTLTNVNPTSSGTTAFTDFADTSWSTATITARGALIYNSSASNKAVAVLDFGADKTSTAGTFSIVFPTADASNAILRLA